MSYFCEECDEYSGCILQILRSFLINSLLKERERLFSMVNRIIFDNHLMCLFADQLKTILQSVVVDVQDSEIDALKVTIAVL